MAGMTKPDLQKLLLTASMAEQTQLEGLRERDGKRFTELNISTRMATQLLLNMGEQAYKNGCREDWALYAHKTVNGSTWGCAIRVAIIVGIIYFVYKIFS